MDEIEIMSSRAEVPSIGIRITSKAKQYSERASIKVKSSVKVIIRSHKVARVGYGARGARTDETER